MRSSPTEAFFVGFVFEAAEEDVLHLQVCIHQASLMHIPQAHQRRAHDALEFHVAELAFLARIPESRLKDLEHDSGRFASSGWWDAVHLLSDRWYALEELVHDHLVLELWPSKTDVIVAGLLHDEDLRLRSCVDSDPYIGLTEWLDEKVAVAVFTDELGALAHLDCSSNHCEVAIRVDRGSSIRHRKRVLV